MPWRSSTSRWRTRAGSATRAFARPHRLRPPGMSNSLAIAAVTAALRHLLDRGLSADVPGTRVTTRPPDKARDGQSGNQVNLFLYRTAPNAAWRNADWP